MHADPPPSRLLFSGALALLLHAVAGYSLWHVQQQRTSTPPDQAVRWLEIALLAAEPRPAVQTPAPEADAPPQAARPPMPAPRHARAAQPAIASAAHPPAAPATRAQPPGDAATPVDTPPPARPPAAAPRTSPRWDVAYLDNPPPRYPPVARQLGWEGTVILRVEVLDSGRPGHIQLARSSGHDNLDEAALKAVRHWRFVPASQGGLAISDWVEVPVEYRLG